VTLSVNSWRITCSLAVVALLLISISAGGQFLKYLLGFNLGSFLSLFDLSLELNIPTFFSLLLLLSASFLLLIVTLLHTKQNSPDVRKWLVLALGFLYMAYDDGFHVHEDLVGIIRPLLWEGNLGIFYYAWIIPAIPMIFFLALYYRTFLFRLPPQIRNIFIIAAVTYLTGCIGFEMIGGYYDESHGGFDSLTYNLISTGEESLEMAGIIIFIHGLLEYLGANFGEVRFQLVSMKESNDIEKPL